MRLTIIPAAFAGFLALAGMCAAAQIASPTIYASGDQTRAECTIGNTGATPISVTITVFDEAGNPVGSPRNCGRIEPHFLCETFVSVSNDEAYACSATTSGKIDQLRGTMILIDANRFPLRSAELR